ncbi:MAG: hypothetical protein LLG00_03670 [Planctomycetaceae bacterium]|nr:hypothetical protein [Planctomycetaceae bacterium]
MDDDKQHRHILVAIMSFCAVVIIYMLGALIFRTGHMAHGWDFVWAIVLGSLAGGGGFAVVHTLDL